MTKSILTWSHSAEKNEKWPAMLAERCGFAETQGREFMFAKNILNKIASSRKCSKVGPFEIR